MIPGAFPIIAGKPPATMTHTATGSINTSGTTHTHSGLSGGVEDGTRFLVAAVAALVTTNMSTCTIFGATASVIARQSPSGGACTELWGAAVAAGASGSVVFTNASSMGSSVVDVFAFLYLNSTTAAATSTDATSPVSTSVAVPDNGFLLAACGINDGAATGAASWSGGVTQVTNTIADAGAGDWARLTSARYDATAGATISPVLTVALASGSTGATAAFA